MSHRQEDLSRRDQHRRLTRPPSSTNTPGNPSAARRSPPSSARGIKFGREAVSNILCSDSPTLSLLLFSLTLSFFLSPCLFHPSRSVSLTLSCSRSCVYARAPFRSSVRRERMAPRRSLRVKSWPIERSGLRPRFFDS